MLTLTTECSLRQDGSLRADELALPERDLVHHQQQAGARERQVEDPLGAGLQEGVARPGRAQRVIELLHVTTHRGKSNLFSWEWTSSTEPSRLDRVSPAERPGAHFTDLDADEVVLTDEVERDPDHFGPLVVSGRHHEFFQRSPRRDEIFCRVVIDGPCVGLTQDSPPPEMGVCVSV